MSSKLTSSMLNMKVESVVALISEDLKDITGVRLIQKRRGLGLLMMAARWATVAASYPLVLQIRKKATGIKEAKMMIVEKVLSTLVLFQAANSQTNRYKKLWLMTLSQLNSWMAFYLVKNNRHILNQWSYPKLKRRKSSRWSKKLSRSFPLKDTNGPISIPMFLI